MRGLEEFRQETAEFLRARGVDAVTAWDYRARVRRTQPVVAVSLRGCQVGPAGMRDYLGERFAPETGRWEELYGTLAEITLGLDIYGPRALGERGCAEVFSRLAEALGGGGPEGLRVKSLTCGETSYVEREDLFRCEAQAVFRVYLYAAADGDGVFSDFVIRGTRL